MVIDAASGRSQHCLDSALVFSWVFRCANRRGTGSEQVEFDVRMGMVGSHRSLSREFENRRLAKTSLGWLKSLLAVFAALK